MRSIDDPAHLTPDQRLAEVASILAAGVRRYIVHNLKTSGSAKRLNRFNR